MAERERIVLDRGHVLEELPRCTQSVIEWQPKGAASGEDCAEQTGRSLTAIFSKRRVVAFDSLPA